MRLRCDDCGFERERPAEEGADLRCPNCREQGYGRASGTNVRVVDAASILRIDLNRTGRAVAGGAKAVAHLLMTRPRRGRGAPTGAADGGGDPGFCISCGRYTGDDGSTINGLRLCGRHAMKAMSRRPNVKRDRDAGAARASPAAQPSPVRERPGKSRRTQAVLSRVRMNEMRRRSDHALPR